MAAIKGTVFGDESKGSLRRCLPTFWNNLLPPFKRKNDQPLKQSERKVII
jgi:hypothetical protein